MGIGPDAAVLCQAHVGPTSFGGKNLAVAWYETKARLAEANTTGFYDAGSLLSFSRIIDPIHYFIPSVFPCAHFGSN